jgi:hypothetical protein
MFSVIDSFLTWWLKKGRYSWSRFRRGLFEAKYRGQSLPDIHSLEEIQACLTQVIWTEDGLLHLYDSISYPQTVWVKKRDDCDGFAILAAKLLRNWQPDYHPVLVSAILRPVKNSHTVCVFNAPTGGLRCFDNSTLQQDTYHIYSEIVDIIKGQSKLVCWDVVDPDTLKTIEFHIV